MRDSMVRLLSIQSAAQLATLRSVLEGNGVPFEIENGHYASIIGPPFVADAECWICVPEDWVEATRELLGL